MDKKNEERSEERSEKRSEEKIEQEQGKGSGHGPGPDQENGKDNISQIIRGDKHCVYTNKDNKKCKGYHQKNSLFCFLHDPAKATERAVSNSQGGKSRAFVLNISPVKIKQPKDITKAVIKTLNEIRKGLIDPSQANSFFYGCNVLLKSFEETDLAARLEGLEKNIKRQ